MNEAVGKTCPYCQTPIKPVEDVVYCSSCSIPHHQQCWNEGQGCTTFGCSGQPSLTPKQKTPSSVVDITVESEPGSRGVSRFCSFCGQAARHNDVHCSGCGRKLLPGEMAAAHDAGTHVLPGPMLYCSTDVVRVYPKARSGARFFACLLDGILMILAYLPLIIGVEADSNGLIFLGLLGLLWGLWYGLTKDGWGKGQSIGKRTMGLMVINLKTGLSCTKGNSALRMFLWFIPYVGFLTQIIDAVMILGTTDGRRIGDHIAGTQVIPELAYRNPR